MLVSLDKSFFVKFEIFMVRKQLWLDNCMKIEQHNLETSINKTHSYLLKINQFADMVS